MLCFHVLARLSFARYLWPALHCVFLLASCLVWGNQKISLPALSISGIFYDPSICNLRVVEFRLPKLTLGRVPLDCCETHGQFTIKQSPPSFEPATTLIIYYSVCSGEVGSRWKAGWLFSLIIRWGGRSMKMWRAELLGIMRSKNVSSDAQKIISAV